MLHQVLATVQLLLTGVGGSYSFWDLDLSDVTCSDPTWGEPVVVQPNGRLKATLLRDCQIRLASAGSISTLNQNEIDAIPNQFVVNEGPIQETFYGMPSTYFNVNYTSNTDGYKNWFNNEIHLVSDAKTQFSKVIRSRKIQGSGNAQYLKVMNHEHGVKSTSEDFLVFQYHESQYVELEQPSFAPTPVFISESKKALLKTFTEDSKNNANLTAQLLLK